MDNIYIYIFDCECMNDTLINVHWSIVQSDISCCQIFITNKINNTCVYTGNVMNSWKLMFLTPLQ